MEFSTLTMTITYYLKGNIHRDSGEGMLFLLLRYTFFMSIVFFDLKLEYPYPYPYFKKFLRKFDRNYGVFDPPILFFRLILHYSI